MDHKMEIPGRLHIKISPNPAERTFSVLPDQRKWTVRKMTLSALSALSALSLLPFRAPYLTAAALQELFCEGLCLLSARCRFSALEVQRFFVHLNSLIRKLPPHKVKRML